MKISAAAVLAFAASASAFAPASNNGVSSLLRKRDLVGDGIDEIVVLSR